ncbi:uncharacterized protein MONOS_6002 [Monocercomonoides exilis]|uniref:uncharacterized protein n=1 Tax=Monocercomonoides exilis TaxID=2049356 RepID=UPI00355AC0EF|nr:hypothetical protein MONOS_6002 [Monocercomonoides exilis]|eukprot:MONOS_6002.1-p1 / transcript=MONOS_6002.1 / gene=MONOS_6002 / organism=Monocercomonoides_exilis_PA203 / gene_product=unspecified product / transcript_product=unspecified product / location=Mono_scaffold00183:2822-3939(+) / protein_length=206 / sequence_SO=supercontig / SO=protein_coding / is_pseudo=false
MEQGVAVCEVEEIEVMWLKDAGLRTEDVVLSPAAIALAVFEEWEEAEEGERRESEEAGRSDGASGCGGAWPGLAESWQDYLVTMTVTVELVELCAERERIVGKPVVEGMIQQDGTMSVTFIEEGLFVRRKKRREKGVGIGGGGCLVSDGVSLHLSSDRQRERMDEFVAIGAVVPQESVPSIALRDATYAIGQVCHGKGMIGVFSV